MIWSFFFVNVWIWYLWFCATKFDHVSPFLKNCTDCRSRSGIIMRSKLFVFIQWIYTSVFILFSGLELSSPWGPRKHSISITHSNLHLMTWTISQLQSNLFPLSRKKIFNLTYFITDYFYLSLCLFYFVFGDYIFCTYSLQTCPFGWIILLQGLWI